MRSARPVGLSQDGRSLIVATPSGEELAIAVDDRLHAALRGDQPRLGQLEIEMENVLTPRDIQTRIRSGESLEDVARVAGLPADRVERFAAPVLAEREHIALMAMSASVRRRGETSGHRLLRLAVTERLTKRGVDIDTVDWDAFRRDDGRWSVSATYSSGESTRLALFVFDAQGRFSVADNDEARWVIGEQSTARGPQPGRKRAAAAEGDADGEPTLDLSDELALVRVIQPPEEGEGLTDSSLERGDADLDEEQDSPEPETEEIAPTPIRGLHSVPDQAQGVGPDEEQANEQPEDDEPAVHPEPGQRPAALHAVDAPERNRRGAVADGPGTPGRDLDERDDPDDGDDESQLDALSRMLDGPPLPFPAYRGLSDASAVPETDSTAWEPAIVVDYPVEPSPEPGEESRAADDVNAEDGSSTADEAQADEPAEEDPETESYQDLEARLEGAMAPAEPASSDDASGREDSAESEGQGAQPSAGAAVGAEEAVEAGQAVNASDSADPQPGEAERTEDAAPAQPASPRPAAKRKRAAVPSWDEIMFGGPTRPR